MKSLNYVKYNNQQINNKNTASKIPRTLQRADWINFRKRHCTWKTNYKSKISPMSIEQKNNTTSKKKKTHFWAGLLLLIRTNVFHNLSQKDHDLQHLSTCKTRFLAPKPIQFSNHHHKRHPQQTKKKKSFDTRTTASKIETILKSRVSTIQYRKLNFLFHRNPVELFDFERHAGRPPTFLFSRLKKKEKLDGFFSMEFRIRYFISLELYENCDLWDRIMAMD